jgi:tetratricopeptide (TPR) repeat protein
MRAAANVAWEGDWEQAIEAYERALTEFPENVDALAGLGMAYASAGRAEDALDVYQRASDLAPEDPVLMEQVGKALERLGRKERACHAYLTCARQYSKQEQRSHLAVACWENAARLKPNSVEAHASLLKHYQQQGQIRAAVDECLTLARVYRDQGRTDYGIRVCQHALKLSPRNAQALALLDKLRYGEQPPEGQDEEEGLPAPETGQRPAEDVELPDAETLEFTTSPADEAAEQKGSPVESTRRKALTDLAESVFEEEEPAATKAERLSKEAIDALISRAIDFQTRGDIEEAIAAYQKALEAGPERPAIHFNLGLLYQENLRFEDAIAQFERAVSHPDYKLGSHFALGECYRARGRINEAVEHFIEVLKIVDLATVEREHADDLINLYEHLTDGYLAKGDHDQALEFANSLVTFLNEQGWEDKVMLARQRLDTLTQEGPVVTLAEALTVPDSERILGSIAMSQEYVKRDMHYAAMEECYLALESAFNYLPIHRQLAEVSLAMGKVDEAVKKLVAIADTYEVRGTARQAAAMYRRALTLAPMDTAVRTKLIDLLISHGEIDQALSNYLILADSFYHLAQMDQALEVYQEALRLAPRVDQERDWTVRILHKIGDIAMQRVDWKRAISVYERIRNVAPSDERARLTLMELYYRLDQPRKAVQELDDLLESYEAEERLERVFAVLNDVVDRWPEAVPLRARLAQAHLDAGHTEEALDHLDKLGDLQLNAGREAQARATIRAIIALQPPNVGEYKLLLEQIGGD